ncbi:AraC family transcriptional regulator [Vibrio sp. Hep-1b-8]|uniref:AraC family transcriptional regulator n=1 Tax=Vibrio sp. Hep-1b-8 TaxID=2144187 RepID=UPI001486775F|nr:AraC family transcriptional regulator [Vibrio sp. Hep-1b-8]
MKKVRFIRAIGIMNIHHEARRRYNIGSGELGIPEDIFNNPMTLIPISVVNEWYSRLERLTGNPDVILDLARDHEVSRAGAISHWLLSGSDFASTIRRLNYGLSSLQNGAFLSASISGSIIKWSYRNPHVEPSCKAHDSIRMAMILVKVMRMYLGDDFAPLRVRLSGIRKDHSKYVTYFGCDVDWSHSCTEIWFHSDLRLVSKQQSQIQKGRLAMNFADLDELLNMPDPEDEVKVIYEVINYSRYYGLPTLEHVSSLLAMSPQQLQRALRKLGMNFSTVCGYVLSNIAVSMLAKGVDTDTVARRLGYQNTASFNRMFKKNRGMTPSQYIQHFALDGQRVN